MLKNWKLAHSLAVFELTQLKEYKWRMVMIGIYLVIIPIFLVSLFDQYMDNKRINHEVFFLLLFIIALYWWKPKDFQAQYIKGKLMANPFFVMLKQLPIKEDAIIKSRLVIQFIYTIPFQFIILVSLYFFSSLGDLLDLGQFLTFILLWISIGILLGGWITRFDIRLRSSYIGNFLIGIAWYFIATIVLTMIKRYTDYHLIEGTVYLTQNWPGLIALLSVIGGFTGIALIIKHLKTLTAKTDY